eukprot:3737163-Ditylum_brightwellii.AAC.1
MAVCSASKQEKVLQSAMKYSCMFCRKAGKCAAEHNKNMVVYSVAKQERALQSATELLFYVLLQESKFTGG